MNLLDKAKHILEILTISLTNSPWKEQLSLLAFTASLLPIPGIQQCAQIADRILNDKILSDELNNIWSEINEINGKIRKINNAAEKLNEIIQTIKFNDSINQKIGELLNSIASEFKLETTDFSYQELLNCVIDTYYASVIADNGSENKIENSQFHSRRTHLIATNKSKNLIDKTSFIGPQGSTTMHNISATGHVAVENAVVTFMNTPSGESSYIIFHSDVQLKCPRCSHVFTVNKTRLLHKTELECPNCHNLSPTS